MFARWGASVPTADALPAVSPAPQVPKGVQISHADVYQLIGAAVVAAAGGPSRAAIYDSLPVGRRDAASADNVAQMPGGGINWNDLACLFCEFRRRRAHCGQWGAAGGHACKRRGLSLLPLEAPRPCRAAHSAPSGLLPTATVTNGYSIEDLVVLSGAHELGESARCSGAGGGPAPPPRGGGCRGAPPPPPPAHACAPRAASRPTSALPHPPRSRRLPPGPHHSHDRQPQQLFKRVLLSLDGWWQR